MTLDRDRALRGAALAVVALVLLRAAVFTTGFASWLDSATLQGFLDIDRPRVSRLAHAIAAPADPGPFPPPGPALVAVALAPRRPPAAVGVPPPMACASAATPLP